VKTRKGSWLTPGATAARQREHECGAFAEALAVSHEASAHFLGGIGAAVQAEALAGLLGDEANLENPREVFLGNSHAVVRHLDPHLIVLSDGDAQGETAALRPLGEGVFGVGDEIDENLQNLVPVRKAWP